MKSAMFLWTTRFWEITLPKRCARASPTREIPSLNTSSLTKRKRSLRKTLVTCNYCSHRYNSLSIRSRTRYSRRKKTLKGIYQVRWRRNRRIAWDQLEKHLISSRRAVRAVGGTSFIMHLAQQTKCRLKTLHKVFQFRTLNHRQNNLHSNRNKNLSSALTKNL